MAQVDADTIAELQQRLAATELEAARRESQLTRYAADLRDVFQQERARTEELRRSYRATVRALANAVEARDAYTGKHAERVAAYGLAVAEAAGIDLGASPETEFGFLLHDVGKVAVPDAILFKRDSLSREEFALMARHPVTGVAILQDVDFLGGAKAVVRHHHEHWDGTGYPDGLSGEDIPLAARLFAVADALDALTTVRPYRQPSSFAEAREIIAAGSGTQFCPHSVAAYDAVGDDVFASIREAVG